MKLNELTLLVDNPRSITDENFKKLVRDIKDDPDFLKLRPILINETEGTRHKRIHHRVAWNNAVPKIINEELKKL